MRLRESMVNMVEKFLVTTRIFFIFTIFLELLRRNPAGAIPVILKRLKQKDLEWRKARQQLNNQWRDILIKNAPRSLDHRSFYFR